MKKIFLGASCLVLMSVICICSAYAADIKIGIIDTQKIMTQSKAAQDARAIFLKEVEENRNRLLAKQNEAQALQDELNNSRQEMTSSVLSEKAEKLTQEVKELNRMKNDLEEDLNSRETSLSQELLNEIGAVVVEYSKQENFTLILEKSAVVTSDDSVDITDQIIRLYDAVQ
ncbi:OmpH family outer membrane protein [Deltaproteobacteria bacterium]|nr:OmpH family outer membrane protein [Deltaproteobacteria bacterium]